MTTATQEMELDAEMRALLTRARRLVRDGEVPSQRKLKDALKIGAPKAKTVFEVLSIEAETQAVEEHHDAPDWTAPSAPEEHRGLRLVPTPERTQETAPAATAESTQTHPEPLPEEHQDRSPQAHPESTTSTPARRIPSWPLLLLVAPAFVAIWSGWVGLGELAGFGLVHPLPGIASGFTLNTAITLPIGVEAYAAYALKVWLSRSTPSAARKYARLSALTALAVGALGQVSYHLMAAAGMTRAPWPITILVACLPVVVLGMGAALRHQLTRND